MPAMNDNQTSAHASPGRIELRAALGERLPDLRVRYGVRSLGIFGAVQRDTHGLGSDLDILVGLDERPISLFQFIAVENELSDHLGAKVNLVEKQALKPSSARRILEEVSYV